MEYGQNRTGTCGGFREKNSWIITPPSRIWARNGSALYPTTRKNIGRLRLRAFWQTPQKLNKKT
jgi:hypothetical protein